MSCCGAALARDSTVIVCLFVYRSVRLSVCLSIYLSFYPSVSWLITASAKGPMKDSSYAQCNLLWGIFNLMVAGWLLCSQIAAGDKLCLRTLHFYIIAASPRLRKRPRVLLIILSSVFGVALWMKFDARYCHLKLGFTFEMAAVKNEFLQVRSGKTYIFYLSSFCSG